MIEKFKRGSLLADSSLVFSSTMIGNIFNYFFQIFVGRSLGPAGYGIFGVFVSILSIISVPATTIQTTIARFVADFAAENRYDKISSLMFRALEKLSIYGIIGLAVFWLGSGALASLLKIPSKEPILVLGIIFLIGYIAPVAMGVLQGMQKFWHYSVLGILGSAFKLFFGVFLIFVGLGVTGAVSSLLFSNLLVFLLALIFLRKMIIRIRVPVEESKLLAYSLPVFVATILLALIQNIDVVLVKYFFEPTEAGYYVAASLFGKIIIYFCGPIAFVMFPKASMEYALTKNSSAILRDALFSTLALSSLVVFIYLMAPRFVVSLIFGVEYAEVAPLIGLFGVAMAFFSLANVLIIYNMALKKVKFLYFLLLSIILEVALIALFHYDLVVVIKTITIAMGFLLTSMLLINKKELLGYA